MVPEQAYETQAPDSGSKR
ncbi:unnamed protein product [Larinioides sclopetarius]|uniref:Uncharacterized protein n=1 Tax=Larinioides sclopetarius TaxID=280406 RepID=A0AAV2AHR6_9ARAC